MRAAHGFLFGILLVFLASGTGECEEGPVTHFSDPETVHQELTTLLQDPQFSPQKTWGQWLDEHLRFRKRRSSFSGLSYQSVWLHGLYWFFFGICIILLIIIVIYILWNLRLFARPFRRKNKSVPSIENAEEPYSNLPYDDLAVRLQSLEQARRFQDALAIMRLVLLKYLHSRKILHFHPSKTNGEYRRECLESYPDLLDLRDYLTQYDRLLYAGQNWGEESYRRMKSLYLELMSHEA